MKRYQCIKTIRHELFEFMPGSIFEFTVNPGENFYGYRTTGGRIIWLTSQELRDHFHELLDLNVDDLPDDPYTDHDAVEYAMFLQNHKGCSRWFTWSIVIAATLLAVLYWALIWRS